MTLPRLVKLAATISALAGAACGRSATVTGDSTASAPDTAFAAGHALYLRDAYDSAAMLWTAQLHDAESLGDSAAVAHLLTWLGIAAWRQSDYATARELGERALALKLRHGFAEQARSYNALGNLAWNEGRLTEAADLLERARESALGDGDEVGAARALMNMGLVRVEQGRLEEARDAFERAHAAGRAANDARLESLALSNLGLVQVRLGLPLPALDALQRARVQFAQSSNRLGEENALGQLALAYDLLGEMQQALATADSALRLARELGLRTEEADNLRLLAALYLDAGDPHRARALLADARQIALEIGAESDAATYLREEARIDERLGRMQEAVTKTTAARQAHRSTGAEYEELLDVLLLAELQGAQGRQSVAMAHLASAEELASRIATPSARGQLALVRARIADHAGDGTLVLRTITAATADLERLGPSAEWEANSLTARAHARAGNLPLARAHGERAVHAVERIRRRIAPGPLRTTFLGERSRAYADLVVTLLRLGEIEQAFEVADAARGRALLEHLSSARDEVSASSTRRMRDAELLLRQIDDLLQRIGDAESERVDERGAGPSHATAGLWEQLAGARREYERVVSTAAAADPASMVFLGASRMSARDVSRALNPGEVLLTYLSTEDRLYIFVVDAGGARVVEVPVTAEQLAARVRLARELTGRRGGASNATVLASLYETLIAPVTAAGALDRASRLLIVAHGPLNYLPFAALRNAGRDRWLIEEFAIQHVPSAGALPFLRERDVALGSRPAPAAGRRVVLAPFPRELPASAREMRSVAAGARGSTRRSGAQATERALRSVLASGSVVHVASHGVMNVQNPMFSRIELARGRGLPDDDGRLEVHEILGLEIRSPLVFLSGCETGVGAAWTSAFTRGEDFTTLAQSFLLAGARDVVGTLWRVADDGAAELAVRFYARLPSEAPPEALAGAQREMIRDPRLRDPYFWAGYQVSGSGGPPR